LETHVQGLHFILQSIKVEMVGDQFALFPPIFVDQSESGAAPSVNGPKFMDQGLDQGGLAHPHVPIETKDLGWGRPEDFPGQLLDFIQLEVSFQSHVILLPKLRKERSSPPGIRRRAGRNSYNSPHNGCNCWGRRKRGRSWQRYSCCSD